MKRLGIISLLLAAVMLFCFAAPLAVGAKDVFIDVESGRWSEASVRYVSECGLMQGVGGGRFDPTGAMTRAMVVTVLWRIENSPEAGASSFSDVPAGEWYAAPVAWAEATGVVSGVGDGRFDPNGKITREQLATILFRYCNYKKYDVTEKGDISVFKDKNRIDSWATDAVSWAVGIGLIKGMTADSVAPLGNATREQVAAILERFMKTEFVNLIDLFDSVVGIIADYTEIMLDGTLELRASGQSVNLFEWRYGMLLLGLAEAGRWDYVKKYVDLFIEYGDECDPCDCGLAGYAILGLYEKTKDEKYLPVIENIKKQMEEWPTDDLGVVLYGSGDYPDVYVDGLGMATPFIARYAGMFEDSAFADIARTQVNGYIKQGVNRITQRAYHGYSSGASFAGEDGWGRGTGWLMHAIGTVMKYCPDDETVEKSEKFIEKTMTYRLETGMFPWSLSDRNNPPSDTSATGMIMWGVMKAKENDLFENVSLFEITRTAKATLSDVKENGAVYGSSGESGGWGAYNSDEHGNYDTTFDANNGWGQGGTLAFLAAYLNYLRRDDPAYFFSGIVEEIADRAEDMLNGYLLSKEEDPSFDLSASQPGTVLIGLAEAGRWDVIKNYIDKWIEYGDVRMTCEAGLLGYVLVCLYEEIKDDKYLPVIEKLKEQTDEWPADEYGELFYGVEETGGSVYVDGTGMFTPFLAKYAAVFGDAEAADNARLQVTNYFKYGVNRITQRAYHGYKGAGVYQGEDGWGRGTGWLMFAIGPVLKFCPDSETIEKSEKYIEKTMTYRLPSGAFPWTLSEFGDIPSDSSATGMIMWGVMKAKESGLCANVKLSEISRTAYACLADVDNGVVSGASGASGGWGSYSENYNEIHGWGQGGVLAFLAAYVKYLNQ